MKYSRKTLINRCEQYLALDPEDVRSDRQDQVMGFAWCQDNLEEKQYKLYILEIINPDPKVKR